MKRKIMIINVCFIFLACSASGQDLRQIIQEQEYEILGNIKTGETDVVIFAKESITSGIYVVFFDKNRTILNQYETGPTTYPVKFAYNSDYFLICCSDQKGYSHLLVYDITLNSVGFIPTVQFAGNIKIINNITYLFREYGPFERIDLKTKEVIVYEKIGEGLKIKGDSESYIIEDISKLSDYNSLNIGADITPALFEELITTDWGENEALLISDKELYKYLKDEFNITIHERARVAFDLD